jgi:putative ABC transport system permease protein
MEASIAGSLARPRLYAVVLASFALSALAIASVGLFGVLSFVVAQRTREIALRSALGARPSQIFALIFRHGMLVTLLGLTAGLLVAYGSVRYLSTLLYGISSHDVVTFVVVPAVIVAIALVACAVPALRALRVDPLTALRS